jgi:hypothetical protein
VAPDAAPDAAPPDAAPTADAAPTVEDLTLHIVTPTPPPARQPHAELLVRFASEEGKPRRIERVMLHVAGQEARELPLGDAHRFPLPIDTRRLVRLQIGTGATREDLLVPLAPNDILTIEDKDGGAGWAASRYIDGSDRSTKHMKCSKRGAQCARGYYAMPNENDLFPQCGQYYCEEAPSVRLREAIEGTTSISPASPDAELGSPAAAALGTSPILVWATAGDSPRVDLGGPTAWLVVSPGEQWTVFVEDGRVTATVK